MRHAVWWPRRRQEQTQYGTAPCSWCSSTRVAGLGRLCATELKPTSIWPTASCSSVRPKTERLVWSRFVSRIVATGGRPLSALRNWLKVREAREGVTALFSTRERWPLSTRRVREIFAELGQAARVPNCHPHRTRHSAATEFLSQRPGAEIQLRSRLGHLSKEVLNDYISISDSTAGEIAEVASLSSRWNL